MYLWNSNTIVQAELNSRPGYTALRTDSLQATDLV